tara:strand:+ start:29 stop:304 length:276 start_codon:yes stop_codon:yes gene_type:complete
MKNLFNKIMGLFNNIMDVINNLFGVFKSKRAIMTTFVTVAWFIFGYMGIQNGTDMSAFSAYFVALSPFVIGYIYGETKRPSGVNCKNENCK